MIGYVVVFGLFAAVIYERWRFMTKETRDRNKRPQAPPPDLTDFGRDDEG